ncbi:TPA: hypothetical protein N0F65_007245 [Lagenidium giganteum]|uniref:Uncharacterized protein n=1 Tax=Lagenidium giganteum TaxID=4803 RepID=A0AAV2YJA2_9STRA|nr:TPA: hypothetical protein N0F65_007245 [Lagenidium giganteum]
MTSQARDVTFMGTIEVLGGLPMMIGVVVLLAVAYIVLVECLLPRRRVAMHRPSRRSKAAKSK